MQLHSSPAWLIVLLICKPLWIIGHPLSDQPEEIGRLNQRDASSCSGPQSRKHGSHKGANTGAVSASAKAIYFMTNAANNSIVALKARIS